MSVSGRIRGFWESIKPKYIDIVRSGVVETDKHALLTSWYYSPRIGQPRGGTPIPTMRKFGQTPQVRMCTKTIIDEITGIDYDIVPTDKFKETYNEERFNRVKDFFKYPNRNGETFDDITKMLLKDILEIDAGVIIKTFSSDGYTKPKTYKYNYVDKEKNTLTGTYECKALTKKAELLEIYARDGGSFLVAPNEFGILPDDKPAYFQYSFIHPVTAPLAFYKRELVYFKMSPRSNSPYGWSPIESIFMVLEALNNAIRYNKKFFEEYAIPSGALSLIGANKDSFSRFMSNWDKKIKGKPHKLVVFNEDMKFTPFNMANKDMQWLEGQKFYQKLVWAMYGVTSDELGFTETSNRSVGQSQSRVFVRRAIKPYLQLLEQKFTNEVITEFYDGEPEVELKFKFIDIHEEHIKRTEEWNDVKVGIRTINEIRLDRGFEPVEWGDEKPNSNSGGFDVFNPPFGSELGDKPPKSEETKKILKKKSIKRKLSYEEFLEKYWKSLEKEVINIFNDEQTDIIKGVRYVTKKSWAGFLRRIIHLFTPENLRDDIKKYIRYTWDKGVAEAENELNLDIGIRESDREIINHYADQQIDGYGLPDGQKWTGIKGVNAQLQTQIGEVVVDGIREGKGAKKIANDIKGIFDTTTSRAMKISRTEGNRIRNHAHLKSYMNSGIEGKKMWSAHIDDRTSPICKELNNQTVSLDGTFETKDGSKFVIPPAHVNCRSRIVFLPD